MSRTDVVLDSPDTIESIDYDLWVSADPTATTPRFQLTAVTGDPASDSWSNAAYNGSWSSTTKLVTLSSPTMSASGGTITVATGTTYAAWAEVTVGSEVIVRLLGTVRVR